MHETPSTEARIAQVVQGVSFERRTVYISSEINAAVAGRVIPALEALDATDGEIRVVINSEGGSEPDGYAIYDAITMCRNRVVMEGLGSVWSIAAAIFQAGDLRRIAPNTSFMIHNGTTPAEEEMKQDAVVALAEQLKKDGQRYYDILSAASQQPLDTIESWCGDETYFNAEEAIQAGFADTLMEPLKIKNKPTRNKKRKKKP